MTTCTLIANPASGTFSPQLLERVTRLLAEGGIRAEVRLTTCADDLHRFAREACAAEERPLLAAMGGDGTFGGMLNGVAQGRATLAFIPAGTSNVLRHELGIAAAQDAVARIVRGRTQPLTVGAVERDGRRELFFLMAGIGFDGWVVRDVRPAEKRRLRQAAYLLSALRRLRTWETAELTVEADGRRLACHGLVACNAPRYGGNFLLAPGASLFSPTLRFLCFPFSSRLAYLRLALGLLRGRLPHDVIAFDAAGAVVTGCKAIQVDGDYLCESPAVVTALPAFARLIV